MNTATGLLHNADVLEKLIFLAAARRAGVLRPGGSQAGVTGPATPAGAIATFWAGVLTGLVVSQLAREGAPFVAKGWGGGGLDMKTMVYGYSQPRSAQHPPSPSAATSVYPASRWPERATPRPSISRLPPTRRLRLRSSR